MMFVPTAIKLKKKQSNNFFMYPSHSKNHFCSTTINQSTSGKENKKYLNRNNISTSSDQISNEIGSDLKYVWYVFINCHRIKRSSGSCLIPHQTNVISFVNKMPRRYWNVAATWLLRWLATISYDGTINYEVTFN